MSYAIGQIKWQNLLDGRCPRCPDQRMTPDGKHKIYCDVCSFEITRGYLLKILTDPNHPIQHYASHEKLERVRDILDPIPDTH